MAKPNRGRPRVISEPCHVQLREYLAFRHRSRHAYAHRIEWLQMRHLVSDLASLWKTVQDDLRSFIAIEPPSSSVGK